jgi:hypothetical protein
MTSNNEPANSPEVALHGRWGSMIESAKVYVHWVSPCIQPGGEEESIIIVQ